MLVTLYFAKEVALEERPAQRLSDSSPLLNNSQQQDHESSQANLGKQDSGRGSEILGKANTDGHLDFNSDANRDQIEAFSDGPGAVLINILTSLRHLPPGMHSVLLVMALTWVRSLVLTFIQLYYVDLFSISNILSPLIDGSCKMHSII